MSDEEREERLRQAADEALRLTGQGLFQVKHDGQIVSTVVFGAVLTDRPDVVAWIRHRLRGLEARPVTGWVGRADLDPPQAYLFCTTPEPVPSTFTLRLIVADAAARRSLEAIAKTGLVGLTPAPLIRGRREQLPSLAALIPVPRQPLLDFLAALPEAGGG